jgi:hypothetical protein
MVDGLFLVWGWGVWRLRIKSVKTRFFLFILEILANLCRHFLLSPRLSIR